MFILPRAVFTFFIIAFGAGVVSSQDFPNKPIRIVTSGAGGGNDFAARLIAPGVADALGQPVLVDNRGAAIAGELVAKAPPDGYTLIYLGSTLWLAPFLQAKVPYDPVRDFSPVTMAVRQPTIVVVHPALPVKSIKELTALAKARPGALNYASGTSGSPTHLAGELFKSIAGLDIVRISYRSGGAQMAAVMSGEVQLNFATWTVVGPQVKSGRLRALAVTSAQPSALIPGLPTVAASGVPGYAAETFYGVFAPAKTSEAVVNRLNRAIVQTLRKPDVNERFSTSGVEVVGSTPDELAAAMKSDIASMGKVIRDAGIRGE